MELSRAPPLHRDRRRVLLTMSNTQGSQPNQAQMDQLRSQFPDITDDEVNQVRQGQVDQVAQSIATRTGQSVDTVRQQLQASTR